MKLKRKDNLLWFSVLVFWSMAGAPSVSGADLIVSANTDGRWIAVQAMDGSNLTEDNPGRHPRGRVLLFAIRDGQAVRVADLPGGEAAQGIVFTADNNYILVQFNVEKQIAVYAVNGGELKDTQKRIELSAGPA